METQLVQQPDAALERRLTPRQEDGAIYKLMAWIVFCVLGLPIGYALMRGTIAAGYVGFLVGLFAFDAGWDLAALATGRGDMLVVDSPRVIIGRALSRMVPVGLGLLFFTLDGEARVLAALVYVAWGASDVVSGRRGD